MKQLLLDFFDELRPGADDEETKKLAKVIVAIRFSTEEQCRELVIKDFPFLLKRQPVHERVEHIFVERLNAKRDDDIDVPYEQFQALSDRLDHLISSIARERLVQGFTAEDMESFMMLKLHQVLRRGQYDPTRDPKKFFPFVFNNLINDINRCKNRALKHCDADALHDCVSLDPSHDRPTEMA